MNIKMKHIPEITLAYIAGFLDGDGSIFAQLITRKDYKWGYQIRLSVQFTQLTKRLDFLEKLRTLFDGVGYIRHKTKKKDHHAIHQLTGVSDFVITEVKHVYAVLKLLQPYLQIKQKQANLAINLIEQLPQAKDCHVKFIELAKVVDHIASLNDTKHRKIASATVIAHFKTVALKHPTKAKKLPKAKRAPKK